jgi:hypothetical protein
LPPSSRNHYAAESHQVGSAVPHALSTGTSHRVRYNRAISDATHRPLVGTPDDTLRSVVSEKGEPTVTTQTEGSDASAPTAFDVGGYWLSIIALYTLQGALWYYPFKEKVFDDELIAPTPIKEQFQGSFVDSFPGTKCVLGDPRDPPGNHRGHIGRQPRAR